MFKIILFIIHDILKSYHAVMNLDFSVRLMRLKSELRLIQNIKLILVLRYRRNGFVGVYRVVYVVNFYCTERAESFVRMTTTGADCAHCYNEKLSEFYRSTVHGFRHRANIKYISHALYTL